ncbi:MAG: phosphate ABC transporter ATP-binding protein [Chloroflexi bacterium]|nr:phosphate ABC transporter ATP-binding protein [Chloroflexota bacterium]OJW05715.1 MAG: phosphate ABC transporter ATP-binding protein [Chloroflexi bacterium 54-19]
MSAKGLDIYYGKFQAVRGVSLEIKPRQITALIGPSGTGKSTFLRSLNRMHELLPGAYIKGQVLLESEDIYAADVDPAKVRRRIGMVFQKPNPLTTKSIFENVAIGLRITGERNKKVLAEQVEQALGRAALWDEVKDKLHRPSGELSGGQQQRLCIARAIAMQPDVILMDEPCSALDPIATGKIEDLMLELRKQYTIVIVTHNMQQAARASDYTVVFMVSAGQPGEVIEVAKTVDIFTNPQQEKTELYVTGRLG